MPDMISENLKNLVEILKREDYLKTPEIIEAFLSVDRADFVPRHLKEDAYLNIPLPIGEGQTISQPLTVAFMLELLSPKSGDKILDIGSGSGWTSALLARIIGKKGKVVAVERIPELCEIGGENVNKYGFIKNGIVRYECVNGISGFAEEAPFDKIIAAAAGEEIPEAWKNQLKIGGVIVAPVKNSIVKITKIGKDQFDEKEFVGFSFVPLVT